MEHLNGIQDDKKELKFCYLCLFIDYDCSLMSSKSSDFLLPDLTFPLKLFKSTHIFFSLTLVATCFVYIFYAFSLSQILKTYLTLIVDRMKWR